MSALSSTRTEDIAIAVFAGGQSRRMGRDKAEMPWRDVPALEHICRVASETGNRVLVVGRECPAKWELGETVFLTDEQNGIGPLGALQTALHWAKDHGFSAVLTLACDTPLLTSQSLRWLLQQSANSEKTHGFVVRSSEQLQPLFAVYQVECLSLIERQLQQHKRSMHALILSGDFHIADAPLEIERQLFNLNTSEEWQWAQTQHAPDFHTDNHESSLD